MRSQSLLWIGGALLALSMIDCAVRGVDDAALAVLVVAAIVGCTGFIVKALQGEGG